MELQLLVKDDWGWNFLCLKVFGFGLHWFTDSGEWFVHIGGKHKFIRFSGDGVLLFGFGRIE